ncbi:hypothetical protein Glove_21g43 [Diversispora epigaea]|uniref:Uncharacterized protein n=1 Tax=Diversispora epigaea TaxID=1348612 RepID=A0A397JMK8_9GLOM|nr:hypothetical protein Glove_21g43 [Diversispora epigaea]
MIENASPELKGFFPSMVNAIIPKERSAYNKQEAKKSIVALCYMIAGLRNKFVNQFKMEVGLYLAASGATCEAIDTMSSLGYSIYCLKIPLVFNGVSVHNPNNIEAWRICWYLLNQYKGIFDITYMERQLYWISQGYQDNQNFDQIELLTVHSYGEMIEQRKEERSMNGL